MAGEEAVDPAVNPRAARLRCTRAVRRPPRVARCVGLLSVAVSRSSDRDLRRGRRVDHYQLWLRPRCRNSHAGRHQVSPLAGFVLFGLYLFYGLQGQLRRVQADGAGPLWRAEIRRSNARRDNRPERRRFLQAQHSLFQLPIRSDDDQSGHGQALRGTSPAARDAADAARDGYCALLPGSNRGSHVAHCPHSAPRDQAQKLVHGRWRGPQLRRQRPHLARGAF